MSEELIDKITSQMQPILEHFDSDHARDCLAVVRSHLAEKLAIILSSQEAMMEQFLFQQKTIASLLSEKP